MKFNRRWGRLETVLMDFLASHIPHSRQRAAKRLDDCNVVENNFYLESHL